jgi:hypothetical protein
LAGMDGHTKGTEGRDCFWSIYSMASISEYR